MSFFINNTPKIPSVLYHYTSAENAMSILTGGTGFGKEICFWLKNSQEKNDKKELLFGETLAYRVRELLQKKEKRTMLEMVDVKPQCVFVNSFSEGEVTPHMLCNYGQVRLEFDFRYYQNANDIKKCMYVCNNDIDTLTHQYVSDVISAKKNNPIDEILTRIFVDNDIIYKIATLKYDKRWANEKEWRQIVNKQESGNGEYTFLGFDNKEHMKIYYSKDFLVGITIFYTGRLNKKTKDLFNQFSTFITENHWEQTMVKCKKIQMCFLKCLYEKIKSHFLR